MTIPVRDTVGEIINRIVINELQKQWSPTLLEDWLGRIPLTHLCASLKIQDILTDQDLQDLRLALTQI